MFHISLFVHMIRNSKILCIVASCVCSCCCCSLMVMFNCCILLCKSCMCLVMIGMFSDTEIARLMCLLREVSEGSLLIWLYREVSFSSCYVCYFVSLLFCILNVNPLRTCIIQIVRSSLLHSLTKKKHKQLLHLETR